MGLTYSQAKALGLEHLWPTGGNMPPVVPAERIKVPKLVDGMNKLERAFWERLRGRDEGKDILRTYREPLSLRLAGRTTYKPDFVSVITDLERSNVVCWEIKGFMRDDAAVKIKVAAELYPWMNFVLVTRTKQKWECRHVTSCGIARETWTPEWLR